MNILDIVIPIRSNDDYAIIARLKYRKYICIPKGVKIIVVDDGSKKNHAIEIEALCVEMGFKYIRTDTENRYMNLSRSRNIALLSSTAEFIMFEDIDLFYSKDLYSKILELINIYLIDGKFNFFSIPVIYLTEDASNKYINKTLSLKDELELIYNLNINDSEVIQHFAPVSSVLVLRRQYAINIGGFCETYEGWGFEDSDFVLRLLLHENIEKPIEFYRLISTPYTKQVDWKGWRSLFRIYGDLLVNSGIYMFHSWHPNPSHRNPEIRTRNHRIFKERTDLFFKNNYAPIPLHNKLKESVLHLSTNPHSYGLQQFEVFDNSIYIDESLINVNNLEGIVNKYRVKSIVLMNPYGNEHRLSLYTEIKKRDLNYFVVERGALPGSIYFDNTGFCAESKLYSEKYWNYELSNDKRKKILNYIKEYKINPNFLEPQKSKPIGGDSLKRKIFGNTYSYKKVIFVALQSPSDTTTTYFCGNILTYDNFINEIKKLNSMISDEYIIAIKNHPLSINKINIDGAINVDEYNINDLIELSEAIILINSGVGVLAQIYEKPVFMLGQAYYNIKNVNYSISTAEEIWKVLSSNLNFDYEKSLKFLYYLVYNFYSFASWERQERKHTDKANMSISKNIVYSKIVLPNECEYYVNEKGFENLRETFLFDRYRCADYNFRKNKKTVDPAPKPAPKPAEYRALAEQYYSEGNKEKSLELLKLAQQEIPNNKNLKRRILKMKYGRLAFWIKDMPFV